MEIYKKIFVAQEKMNPRRFVSNNSVYYEGGFLVVDYCEFIIEALLITGIQSEYILEALKDTCRKLDFVLYEVACQPIIINEIKLGPV